MKRLFIAIKIEPDERFLQIYNHLNSSLKYESLRFIEIDKIHLTLRFLGETPEVKIVEIDRILSEVTYTVNAFSLNINRVGVFGSSYNPRVLWMGIDKDEPLILLHKIIERNLSRIGFYPDRQNFVPHLTLTRIKQLKDLKLFQKIISPYKDVEIMSQSITSFTLYESILKPQGPTYIALNRFQLKSRSL
ncbi:MAG: RNA 2',3'-cyclic phosphodiesterase [Bacteroidetes bacterium]|nr:RNA 2',3'-cyclic phosphodiesterase [Bacteroidota bacterium]